MGALYGGTPLLETMMQRKKKTGQHGPRHALFLACEICKDTELAHRVGHHNGASDDPFPAFPAYSR